MQTHDEWISAWNILPPTSPTGLDMRDAFDAEAFVEDAYLHAQWQRTLDATEAPWRFEQAPRRWEAPAAPTEPPTVPPPPPTLGARQLTDDVPPFEDTTQVTVPVRPVSAHARSRSVENFVRDMFVTYNQVAGAVPQYYSLGEVARYFNHFIVDVNNNGPYTCFQLSAMHNVPEVNVWKLWTFRPGAESLSVKQVASRLKMRSTDVRLAYRALGFQTWVLTRTSVKK
jgi:hypothetical protein